jgi:hypothetical protein
MVGMFSCIIFLAWMGGVLVDRGVGIFFAGVSNRPYMLGSLMMKSRDQEEVPSWIYAPRGTQYQSCISNTASPNSYWITLR